MNKFGLQEFLLHGKPLPNKPSVIWDAFNKIFLIALNRPKKINAFCSQTITLLAEAINVYQKSSAHAAVLFGLGGNFSSGYDVNDLDASQTLLKLVQNPRNSLLFRFNTEKPVIAALSGYAVAGGLELALLADIRICDKNTCTLGLFNRRFGVSSYDGIASRNLPRIVGSGRAMDFILTGRPIYGKEAFDIGLVNLLTEDGTAIGKAMNYATCLAKFPQEGLVYDLNHTVKLSSNSTEVKETNNDNNINPYKVDPKMLKKAQNFLLKGKGPSFNIDNL